MLGVLYVSRMSDSELKKVVEEVSRPDYYQRAREATEKPFESVAHSLGDGQLWRRLLWIAPCSSVVVRSRGFAALLFRSALRAGQDLACDSIVFAALPLGMIAANFLIHFLPPARRALDREAEGYPGTDFVTSQRQLWAIGRVVTIAGFTISFLVGVFVRIDRAAINPLALSLGIADLSAAVAPL